MIVTRLIHEFAIGASASSLFYAYDIVAAIVCAYSCMYTMGSAQYHYILAYWVITLHNWMIEQCCAPRL